MNRLVILFQSFAAWMFVGLSTALLSLTALVLILPVSLLLEGGKRGLLHGVSQLWARLIARTLPLWDIRAEGLERVRRGRAYVIVCNHQSMLDILLALACLPVHFKFIAKRELFWVPFLGWHLAVARYICLRRGDALSGRQAMEKARQWIQRGVSVVFFPEGTRSPDGEIHEFKAGAFKVALEEKAEILPVVVTGTRNAIPKHSWFVRERVPLGLRVLSPEPTEGLSMNDLDSLRERVRSRIRAEFERQRKGNRAVLARPPERLKEML